MKTSSKILLTAGAIAAGAAAASFAAGKAIDALLSVALDREAPQCLSKLMPALTGSKTVRTIDEESEKNRKRLEEVAERVGITGYDGKKLVGHFYPAENPKRILLAFHGWRSLWSRDFRAIFDFWHDNGSSVLFVEQRGQGESEGDFIGFGLTERLDVPYWAEWLNENVSSVLPIYLVGISMGATTVLMASGDDLPENVRGVIADCGFTSPDAIWKHIAADNLHFPYSLVKKRVDAACRGKIGFGAEDWSTVDALGKTKLPVFFIHGGDDTFVPVEMTYENYAACSSPKKILIAAGADHGMSYVVEKEKYQSMVREFWEENDSVSSFREISPEKEERF